MSMAYGSMLDCGNSKVSGLAMEISQSKSFIYFISLRLISMMVTVTKLCGHCLENNMFLCKGMLLNYHFNGLLQERCNSIANALELHLSCTNPLIYTALVQGELRFPTHGQVTHQHPYITLPDHWLCWRLDDRIIWDRSGKGRIPLKVSRQ